MDAVREGDREAWLALFAADAALHDPVGGSPLDPEGRGISGREELERFWDLTIAPNEVDFEIRESHPAGSAVALVATVRIAIAGGARVGYDGVFVYELNRDGEIAAMRGYWNLEQVLKALG